MRVAVQGGEACPRFRFRANVQAQNPGSGPVAKPRQATLGPRKRLAELCCRGVQVPVLTTGSSFILSHLWMASPLPKTELVNECEIFVFRPHTGGFWQVRSR